MVLIGSVQEFSGLEMLSSWLLVGRLSHRGCVCTHSWPHLFVSVYCVCNRKPRHYVLLYTVGKCYTMSSIKYAAVPPIMNYHVWFMWGMYQ